MNEPELWHPDKMDELLDEGEDIPEPVNLGIEMWFECKHCEGAWLEAFVDDIGNDDLELP